MKIYAYLFAAIAFLAYSWGMYHMGGAGCREDSAKASMEHTEKQNQLLADLEKSKKPRDKIYVDKIRVVRESNADCLSMDLSDAVRLQLSGGSAIKPATNP